MNKQKEEVVDEEVLMLTTIDNPFNPFTNFEDWFAFDELKGYNTCSYLERIDKNSFELSDKDQIVLTNDAINEIVELNLLGIYRKVTKDSWFLNDRR